MALTVVKCGGAFLARGRFDLARYLEDGSGACVVHGAGARITRALAEAGVEAPFVAGRRVTNDEALPIVREAYRAENQDLCRQIGSRAVGLMGDELGLVAQQIAGYGRVGMLLPEVPPTLWGLLATEAVPVIAPLAQGPLNVNADDAAAVLAVALFADRLVFVSDVPGVIVDGEVVPALNEADIASLDLTGGIVPKLQAALVAAREGIAVAVGRTAVSA